MPRETRRNKLDNGIAVGQSVENAAALLMNAIEDMAFLINAERRVLCMNDALLQQLGKSVDDVIGTSIYDYAPLPWREGQADEIDAMFETQSPVFSEVEVYGCTVELRGYPVLDDIGDVSCFAVFMRDITERKRVEQQWLQSEMLRLEVQKDRDLLKKQEQFMSMVSHELRNPLTAIRGSLDILEQYYERLDDERRLKHFARIGQQVESMKSMLQDLLTLRKASSEGFQFAPQPVDVSLCCTQIYHDVVQESGNSRTFTLVDHGPTGFLMLDPTLLRHILVNLMTNAVKYTSHGGEIRLEIDQDDEDVICRVADNGIGIPTHEQKRLFEPFFRAGNTTRIEGTGLGLSIAQTCTQLHGGMISFDSIEGRGTTFCVRLPKVLAVEGV
jgi:PAS domain S-box-containing protein